MGRLGIDDIEDLRGLGLDKGGRDGLVRTASECTVAFTSPSGWPSGVVMSFLYDRERFWLTAVRGRAHVTAVLADPRVTLVISGAGTSLPRQMLAVAGTVTVHDDRATKAWFFPAFAARMAPADPQAFVRLLDSPNRVIFEVKPERITASHDSRKMPGDGRGGPRRNEESQP
ncbi:pyridoxamine 5'-phosphate oxidase family protein [Georgenia sp. AZ-5]|uniref:pyridoxamine 5'-phosphate oxidase family protein n=1 Tax=Georgenia sp. AZ-5 TaxID=3367526 RepID=UPI003754CD7F